MIVVNAADAAASRDTSPIWAQVEDSDQEDVVDERAGVGD